MFSRNAASRFFFFVECPSVSFGSLGLCKLYPMVDVANTTVVGAVNEDMAESFVDDESVPPAGGGGDIVNSFLSFSSFLM